MSKAEHSSSESICPSCQTALHPGAKFCHECGAHAGDQPGAKRWNWKNFAPVAVSITAGVGLILVLGKFATERKDPPNLPQLDTITFPRQFERPVDLSTMTPREAADRLFNRVMAAEEGGDTAQARRFAPMALQAYRLVDRPDADAYFHIGQINLLLGNLDEVRTQIENLKRDSAEHLLGLALALRVAKRVGDDKSVPDILARFAAAYDAEIKAGKPEYEAHRVTIENLRVSAMGLKTVETTNLAPKRQESGAQLFESKCMGCHGPGALGSAIGPPLVHRIYEPGHHANASFYQAIRQGVKGHHWSFGDMLPVPGVTDEQIDQIVLYVRKLQVKNGIN